MPDSALTTVRFELFPGVPETAMLVDLPPGAAFEPRRNDCTFVDPIHRVIFKDAHLTIAAATSSQVCSHWPQGETMAGKVAGREVVWHVGPAGYRPGFEGASRVKRFVEWLPLYLFTFAEQRESLNVARATAESLRLEDPTASAAYVLQDLGSEPSSAILPAHQVLTDALLGRWLARGHVEDWTRLQGCLDGRAPSPGGLVESLAHIDLLADAATRISLPRWLEACGLGEAAGRLHACPRLCDFSSRKATVDALASVQREIDQFERGMSQELEQEVRGRLKKAPPAIRGMAALSIPVAIGTAAGEAATKVLSVLEAVDAVTQTRRNATELRLDCDEEHTTGAQALSGLTEMLVRYGRRLAAGVGARASLRNLDELMRTVAAGAETTLESKPERDWPGAFALRAQEATRAHLGKPMRDSMEAVETQNRKELVDWMIAGSPVHG